MKVEPIEEPIEPMILTSALVVANSAGVETIATIDLSPGLTTWLIALETKITKRRSPLLVPSRKGVRKQIAPKAAKLTSRIWRFGRESASMPPWSPKSRAARNEADFASEISNWLDPAAARKTMMP